MIFLVAILIVAVVIRSFEIRRLERIVDAYRARAARDRSALGTEKAARLRLENDPRTLHHLLVEELTRQATP
jgi:hypothetical protein